MSEILTALVEVSEKSANLARGCKQEEALFQLLVQEKLGDEKNKKFVNDFKTLADVLVQEVIKHDMGKKFPGLEDHIFGEESNEFTNSLGEKIKVNICGTESETALLLSKVLDGNMTAAGVLAKIVHHNVSIVDPALEKVKAVIPQDTIAMWVDPIDSTFQYIEGLADEKPTDGIYAKGLQCVTILIGVYDRNTGLPIMGVINQPFIARDPETLRWRGQYFWGISYGETKICSLHFQDQSANAALGNDHLSNRKQNEDHQAESNGLSVVMSTSENENIKRALSLQRLYYAAGAGYKCLCAVQGFASLYLFSEDTTFKWDCCAPHAILRSLGGGMVDFRECLKRKKNGSLHELPELVYNAPVDRAKGAERWANKGGLVAFRSPKHLDTIMNIISELNL
ncbi:inositol polyphosphate 1-phosphatase [Callorhinchus milii]|uniref:Inositol polyphosphate 1-phosphatase n=1 Tax=Callorhinchus milii TaxID=7868 RepID=V9KTR0_CALMI|nr:inositol polyphosphate 1-phosphatase [Callorhinchus milii]|eukprot:gi/632946007/ref/XP_007888343.1/ PREDICTED: inositol polyphosphate 1-phosphatase [Callorhinchus milii]